VNFPGSAAYTKAAGVSLVTNASVRDAARLRAIIPHWFRMLGDEISEVSVLLDPRGPEGRIARLQKGDTTLDSVKETLNELACTFDRFRWRLLDYSTLELVSRVWWQNGTPLRCQDGTPIFAFAAVVLDARCRYVLRADCDMLFLNRGWVGEAVKRLEAGEADIVSPPRLGVESTCFSSRAAMVAWPVFRTHLLPMRAARLDLLRRLHRTLRGRPTFLAFEDSIKEAINRGEVRHLVLPVHYGQSLHVVRAADPASPAFPAVVMQWENNNIPKAQIDAGWDFEWCHWPIEQS